MFDLLLFCQSKTTFMCMYTEADSSTPNQENKIPPTDRPRQTMPCHAESTSETECETMFDRSSRHRLHVMLSRNRQKQTWRDEAVVSKVKRYPNENYRLFTKLL
ncbi:hypothetical protein T265_03908 [Opisthorchis viverrini]|uniref:Uncharacterized protein n=1 Tax=Opisthorchis viverrini TaxID=6198 RepID=A0A074ZUB9_OPIVI|nr:hypothetical protein T265_03908 [Opisthorchis viverrini]KER29442.1 hypothetical protein T265_03908 [Opisthorchis viverrini]